MREVGESEWEVNKERSTAGREREGEMERERMERGGGRNHLQKRHSVRVF